MNEFLNEYLLLSNKNNILEINLGKKKSSNIFDANLKKTTIKNIIEKIKQIEGLKYKQHSYTIKVFVKNDEYFTLRNRELTYEIRKTKDYYIDNKFLVKNILIEKDEYIIPTYNDYNDNYTAEILDINIQNQVVIRIIEKNNSYSAKLVISKPVKISFIEELLQNLN